MLRILTFNTGLTEIRLFGAALYEDVPHVVARAAHLAPALRGVDADILLLQELVPATRQGETGSGASRSLPPQCRHRRGQSLLRHRTARPFPPSDDKRFVHTLRAADAGGRPLRPARDARLHGAYRPASARSASSTSTPPPVAPIGASGAGARPTSAARRSPRRSRPPARPLTARSCSPATSTAIREQTPRPAGSWAPSGFTDVAAGLPNDARPQGTWDPANPLNRSRAVGPARRVDHIFVRLKGNPGIAVAAARTVLDEPLVPLPDGEPLPVSDHYGLLAELATF